MTCPRCQAKIAPSDRYCINCGADIALISQNIRPADVVSESDLQPETSNAEWSSTASSLAQIQGSGRQPMRVVLLVAVYLGLFLVSAAAAHWILESRSRPKMEGLSLGKPRLVTRVSPTGKPDAGEPAAVIPGAGRSTRPARRSSCRKNPRPGKPWTRQATAASSAPVTEPAKTASPPAVPPGAPSSPAKKDPGITAPVTSAPTTTPTAVDAGRPPASSPPAPGPKMGSIEKFRVSLNVGSVQMVVRHHLPQLRLCYGRNIKGDAVRGVVEIRFTVNEQGKVGSASVYRGHQAVGRCIVGKLRTWRFPRPVGGEMTFIYPFAISG